MEVLNHIVDAEHHYRVIVRSWYGDQRIEDYGIWMGSMETATGIYDIVSTFSHGVGVFKTTDVFRVEPPINEDEWGGL